MIPADFLQAPWKDESLHEFYRNSFLHMRPAPEYASGEVVLASLYRNVGFSSAVTESKVPTLGRDFLRRLDRKKGGRTAQQAILGNEAWRGVVTGSLRSPKQPNQASKRFLQICPIVPDAAIYSLSARLSANSWNPGQLVARALNFGSPHSSQAAELWRELFAGLSVNSEDDIWARFLMQEFLHWRPQELVGEWKEPQEVDPPEAIVDWHMASVASPGTQFVKDLREVLELKPRLTRRQWISVLESVLRLGTASHVLWICRANAEVLAVFEAALRGEIIGREEIGERLCMARPFWSYNQLAVPTIREFARNFVVSRVGLNLLLLHYLQAFGVDSIASNPLTNMKTIAAFAKDLYEKRSQFPVTEYRDSLIAATEADPRVVACKRGISANISEFLRHVLGQRQTSEPGLDTYDQGFYLRKRGAYSGAPWAVSIGPVATIMLSYCCSRTAKGPRTVEDFCNHLAMYGIAVNSQEIGKTSLGQTLRNLGLVLDSPDAEGGMVLVNPFGHSTTGASA